MIDIYILCGHRVIAKFIRPTYRKIQSESTNALCDDIIQTVVLLGEHTSLSNGGVTNLTKNLNIDNSALNGSASKTN